MLTSYGLSCEQLFVMDLPAWRRVVKQAVLHRALFFYEPKQSLVATRLPDFIFEYLGRPYLHHPRTSELAELAVQMRADRLPGVPQPYIKHPCVWCHQASSLSGLHLMQCCQLPASLAQERESLREQIGHTIPLRDLAGLLVACSVQDHTVGLTRQGLSLFRKISQAVKRQLHATGQAEADRLVDSLVQLFDVVDDAFPELEAAVTNDRFPA